MPDFGQRVLLVAYYFPPAGGISVQRVLSLAKYLPAPDCRVDVLTTWNGAYPTTDPDLLAQVPPSVRVHRVFTPEPPYGIRKRLWSWMADSSYRGPARRRAERAGLATPLWDKAKAVARNEIKNVLLPDPQVAWNPFATWAASRLVERERYDSVMVTAPPFSSFRIGIELKRRYPWIRLVSDFRDDWLGFFLGGVDAMATEEKRQFALRLERETVETSDLVVAVTQATSDDIRSRYPEQPASKFQVVHNGYDPRAVSAPPARTPGPRMVITYAGTVYRPCSPRRFLDAVDSLPAEIRDCIECRFVGRVIEEEAPHLQGRKGMVRTTGFVSHQEALRHMADSDFLLLLIDDRQTLSGKIFEYLAMGRPIIALTPPEGESGRLVQRTRAGHVVAPGEIPEIAALLRQLVEAWKLRRHQLEPDWDAIRQFERPRLATRYRELLRSTSKSSVPASFQVRL